MIEIVLLFCSKYLIEFMGALLILGLIFRALAYNSSKLDDIYFSSLTREIEKCLDEDKRKKLQIEDVDNYLMQLLGRVMDKLPTRSIRFGGKNNNREKNKLGASNVVSLRDYVGGQKSFLHSINNESSAFKSPHPPNYKDLTNRILNQDENWVKLFGVIPIDGISRLIDILPGLFVVFGIFGTFVGISQALPEIAKIDFNNLETSGVILSNFVKNVTFAMSTSIAGILFSLILTFLNTLVPIKGLRNQTFKKVSNCFEAIWYNIHGGSSFEKEMARILPALLNSVQKLEEIALKSEKNSQANELKRTA